MNNKVTPEDKVPLIINIPDKNNPVKKNQTAICFSQTEILVKEYFDQFVPPSLTIELPRCRETEIYVNWGPFLITSLIPLAGVIFCYFGLTTLDLFASNAFLIRFIPYAGYIVLSICLFIPYIVRCSNIGQNFHRIMDQTFEHRAADAFRFLHSTLTSKLYEAQGYADRLAYEYKSDISRAQSSITVPASVIPDLSRLQISNITARDMLYEALHIGEIEILQDKFSLGLFGLGCHIASLNGFLCVMSVIYLFFVIGNLLLISMCLYLSNQDISDETVPYKQLNKIASLVLFHLLGLFMMSLSHGQSFVVSIFLKSISWEITRRIRKIAYETYGYIFIDGVSKVRFEVNDLISRKIPLLRTMINSAPSGIESAVTTVTNSFAKLFK